jgi:phosphate-selective porin OprO/OprP
MVALTIGTAAADDNSVLLELKARLDKLEKQNEELKEKLSETSAYHTQAPVAPPVSDATEKEKLKKEIDAYMQEKEQQKKDKDAADKDSFKEVGGLPLPVTAEWIGGSSPTSQGLWFKTADNAFRFHMGGWTDLDYVGVSAAQRMETPLASQGVGKFDDGVNMRRTRLRWEGTMWDQFDFLFEIDYSLGQRVAMPGNSVAVTGTTGTISSAAGTVADRGNLISIIVPTDLWGRWRGTPIGNIQIGNVKPMYSMEQLMSSRFIDLMEFSYIWDAFLEQGNNGWIPSIAVWDNFGENKKFFYGASVGYSNNKDLFFWNQGDGELEETARFGWTIINDCDQRRLLNISVGSMHQGANDGSLRYRARFDLRNGNNVQQPTLAAVQGGLSDAYLIQPELFANWGSFNVQAEWAFLEAAMNRGTVFTQLGNQTSGLPAGGKGELYYNGGYISLGYFLTGETRAFDTTWKTPERVVPIENAFTIRNGAGHWNLGRGAWQVLARWNYLNLDSKGANGGILNGLTLGLNWYLNPNMRFMFDAVADHRDAVQYIGGAPATPANTQNGWLYGAGARFHMDF